MMRTTNGRLRLITGTISTDDIIPGKYKHMFTDLNILAKHIFENAHPNLNQNLQAGDILWSQDIFGIGSSREQAPASLQARGIRALIAPRFGRIFYRNAWNVGLPVLTISEAAEADYEGAQASIDWENGKLTLPTKAVDFPPPPQHLRSIASNGGLIATLRLQMKSQTALEQGA